MWNAILWLVLAVSLALGMYQIGYWLLVDETTGLAFAAVNLAFAAMAGYDLRRRRARRTL
jgi:hypothetical protein